MKRFQIGLFALMVMLAFASPALAANPGDAGAASWYGRAIGAGIGAGLTILGAGWGFGRIGASALESMARQPEVAPRVQTAMLIIAALLEGATFFALIICIIMGAGA